MNTILKVSNVEKRYKDFCLSDVNFEVEKGNIVGLVGENGAGKTTLISLILHQRKADRGNIEIFNQNVVKLDSNLKQKIGFYNDECCFHPCFTAMDIHKILRSIYEKWDKVQYMAYLSQFKVPLNKKIGDMSKGTKNKLMLAISLSYHASFLIFDEITSGLDPIVRKHILQAIKEYVSIYDATVFFSTHITSDLEDTADKILFLHQGTQILYKDIEQLKKDYRIYQCNSEKYTRLMKKGFERVLISGKKCMVLMRRDSVSNELAGECEIPSIEDFMRLYIEGEVCG